jgi:hypothetical protein
MFSITGVESVNTTHPVIRFPSGVAHGDADHGYVAIHYPSSILIVQQNAIGEEINVSPQALDLSQHLQVVRGQQRLSAPPKIPLGGGQERFYFSEDFQVTTPLAVFVSA